MMMKMMSNNQRLNSSILALLFLVLLQIGQGTTNAAHHDGPAAGAGGLRASRPRSLLNEYPISPHHYTLEYNGEAIEFTEMQTPCPHDHPDHDPGCQHDAGVAEHTIVLQRGEGTLQSGGAFYNWLTSFSLGQQQVEKHDVTISLIEGTHVVLTWDVAQAYPTELTAPEFNVQGNDVAIERLVLMAESMTLSYDTSTTNSNPTVDEVIPEPEPEPPVDVPADETTTTISGTVFEDVDGDGDGDSPLVDVMIDLIDNATGVIIATAYTNGNGTYEFNLTNATFLAHSYGGLLAGHFHLRLTNPPGYESVSDTDGANDSLISVGVMLGDSSTDNGFVNRMMVAP